MSLRNLPDGNQNLSNTLIADMYGHLPNSIDVSNLGTTSEYGFMLHVTRPLVKYSRDLQIEEATSLRREWFFFFTRLSLCGGNQTWRINNFFRKLFW